MAFFGVTTEVLEKVWPHPNADRLDLAKMEGMDFQFVVGKARYQAGNKVIYFPVDALLPEAVLKDLGLEGKLSGKERNRVKTIKLRGQISQGIVCKAADVLHGDDWEKWKEEGWDTQKLTEHLGVTKYEPPVVMTMAGNLVAMPSGIGVYDIEGADRYTDVVKTLLDMQVSVTEKLEGTNFAAVREPDGTIYYCTRKNRIIPIEDKPNKYVETAERMGVPAFLDELAEDFVVGQRYVLRGELLGPGIQKNIYKLPEHRIYFFDLKINGWYMAALEFYRRLMFSELPVVPELASDRQGGHGLTLSEWLEGSTVQDASNGYSVLNSETRREGIVIRPWHEESYADFDGSSQRLIIKQRSPEYLANEK